MKKSFLLCVVAVVAVLAFGCQTRPSAPPPPPPVATAPPLGLAEIKSMAKAGVSDDAIVDKIQSSQSVYRLSSADITDLKNAGVSAKVIDFMIGTANQAPAAVAGAAPPPPVAETMVAAPGPQYVWVGGDWDWNGLRWVWIGGRWLIPPYPGAVWIHGRWVWRRHRYYWVSAHWR